LSKLGYLCESNKAKALSEKRFVKPAKSGAGKPKQKYSASDTEQVAVKQK